jgi:15-cis-phytoene synthase
VSDDLDSGLRRADPDRWLSSRFITDPAKRADVVAIYAFNQELARVAAGAREPMVAEIRLTWWREGLDDLMAGKPARGHPVMQALAQAIGRNNLAAAPLEALADASFDDLEPGRFADEGALEGYLDATSGAIMALACAITGGVDAGELRPAAHAWGLVGLIRRRAAGLDRFPEGWSADEPLSRARQALAAARAQVAALPVEAFPAVAHLALAGGYLADREPSELEKRARLMWAVVRGRV